MTPPLSRRTLVARVAAMAAFGVAAALGGCDALFGKRWSYRYKLTLSLDTPDGVKTGSSVVQVTFYTQSFPEQGTFHSVQGEAVYVDLGPGQRPLVTLIDRPIEAQSTLAGGNRARLRLHADVVWDQRGLAEF